MKRQIAITLIGLLVLIAPFHSVAQTSGKDEAAANEKVKAKIEKLAVGKKTRAQIKLRTGEKIKGQVTSVGENDFAFAEQRSGQVKTIAYKDVVEARKSGGLSTAAKIGIGVGIGVAVLAIVAIHVKNHLFDNLTLGQR